MTRAFRFLSLSAALPLILLVEAGNAAQAEKPACRIVCDGTLVALESPAFAFTLDTADGLRAVSWTNRRTGKQLLLDNGAEVEFDLGLPDKHVSPNLRVTKRPSAATAAQESAALPPPPAEPAAVTEPAS